jgi:crotonobetainyl-CoA:carnitine CoA-transferase CaiB-like acyl-CoA transferase
VPLSTVLDVSEALTHPAWTYRTELANGATDEQIFFRGLAREMPAGQPPAAPLGAARPLTGLRILEFGLYTAAPLAGKLLAQLGADVLKVEPPTGEPGRRLGSKLHGSSYLYYLNNTDKRGCVVDMNDPAGRAVMAELVAGADVFLTNLTLDGLAKSGLGFDDLTAINPALIYCSISGYGASGPNAGRRVLDTVMQAMSGIMHLTGRADGPPAKVAVSICDLIAAWVAAIAIVAAWRDTETTTGRAQFLDVSMLDASMWLVRGALSGGDPHAARRQGTGDDRYALHDVFATADGVIAVSIQDRGKLTKLIAALDIPDGLASWMATTSTAEVLDELRSRRIPAAPVARLTDAAAPTLIDIALDGGSHKVFGSPFDWPRRDVAVRTAAPRLGEHAPQWLPRTSQHRHQERVQS